MGTVLSPDDIVIADAARSILGSDNGSLKDFGAVDLAAGVVEQLLEKVERRSPRFSRKDIDCFACGLGVGAGIGQNLPRQITHKVGLDEIKAAFVLNEMCGSGMGAILAGAQSLKLGEAELVLAGGVEAPAAAPWLISRQQLIDWKDLKVGDIQEKLLRSDLHDALWDKISDVHTIWHAENTTARWVKGKGLDPEVFKRKIDDYAKLSHDRALAAAAAGEFQEELAPLPGAAKNDELPAKKNIELMYKRKGTIYTPQGEFLSNHNSPPLANGACFLLLMTRRKADALGLEPLSTIKAYARSGVKPEDFLLAPLAAVRELLKKTQTAIGDYDLVESNSAFGSQMLINQAELGLDMDKVNVRGDCIALGHPIGAAGARITTTLLHSLKQKKKRQGLALICLGGGNGIALAVENESEKFS
ncbi:MAG: thiolase family protein [Elusimicrobiota bacterium]|jgi:acetyl-CoA C-acetyltransferase